MIKASDIAVKVPFLYDDLTSTALPKILMILLVIKKLEYIETVGYKLLVCSTSGLLLIVLLLEDSSESFFEEPACNDGDFPCGILDLFLDNSP